MPFELNVRRYATESVGPISLVSLGTPFVNGAAGRASTISDITVSGSDPAIIAGFYIRQPTTQPDTIVIWDNGGSTSYNQALRIYAQTYNDPGNTAVYGLENPRPGNRTLVGVKGSSTVEVFFAGMAINNVKQNGGTTSFGAGATHLAASQVDFTANVGDFSFTQYAIPGGTATDPVTGADGDQFTNALSDGAVVAWKAMTTTTASFTSLGSPNSANVAQFNPRNGSGGGRGAPTGSLTPTLTTYQFLASGANYSVTVSGSNTALAVVLTFDGIVPTGVTVTHHGNTVPLVGSVDNGSNLCSQIYGVANPDAGTNNVVVSWTGGQHVFVYALVFTGANQTTPFYGFSSNTNALPSIATAGAVIQDTTPGDYGICIGSGTSGTAAPSGNTAFEDHTSGTTINAYGGYQFSFLGGDIYCGVTTASLISGGTAAACGVRQA